jgi:DnaJ-class molecular chaperone
MSNPASDTTADYECENCIGMAEYGCYCQSQGAIAPGGPAAPKTVRVLCEACGGEGRIYKSKWGGNDPDVWDAGQCPACEGTAYVEVEAEPITMTECAENG